MLKVCPCRTFLIPIVLPADRDDAAQLSRGIRHDQKDLPAGDLRRRLARREHRLQPVSVNDHFVIRHR